MEMEIKLEDIEALMERANVNYEEARAALTETDGDLLEALINLEREGKTKHRSASFSTNENVPVTLGAAYDNNGQGGTDRMGNNNGGSQAYGNNNGYGNQGYYGDQNNYDYKKNTSGFGDFLKSLCNGIGKFVHKGNVNYFEAYRHGKIVFSIPVTALVIILLVAFWFTLPALVVGLFFGCRYRFRGPDLGRDNINKAMDTAYDTADNIKQSVKDAYDDPYKE